MIEFKGFDDWVPIFKGGPQKDSQGREHDGDALIEKAVSTFNAAVHEPPAVIGHPADNAPAWGWVEALKAGTEFNSVPGQATRLLLAKFKQVQPAFADMVKQGLFKKRSAAFYPNGSLRHVGFLGAMPPAVKGLPDLAFAEFSEPADASFEFMGTEFNSVPNWKMQSISEIFRRLREWLIEKFDTDTADRIVPNWTIEDIKTPAAEDSPVQTLNYSGKETKMDEFIQKLKDFIAGAEKKPQAPAGQTFSEADLEKAKKEAADEAAKAAREALTAEFAENARKARLEARKQEIDTWCDTMVAQGKLTPAMAKYGVKEMLAAFAEKDDLIEFGEGDGKVKATLFDRFKGLFETELPKVIDFKEIATRDKDTGGQGGAGAKIDALIVKKREANKDLDYAAAFAEVQRENPDLAQEYRQEIGQ